MGRRKRNKLSLYFMVWNMVSSAVSQVLFALEDRVIDEEELIEILKDGLRNLKLIGIVPRDLWRFRICTDPSELNTDAYQFIEGDALLHLPGELLSKLKIELSEE